MVESVPGALALWLLAVRCVRIVALGFRVGDGEDASEETTR